MFGKTRIGILVLIMALMVYLTAPTFAEVPVVTSTGAASIVQSDNQMEGVSETQKTTEESEAQKTTGEGEAQKPAGKQATNETSETQEAANAPDLAVKAKSAVLLDAGSGKFLYMQNAHEELAPASVTKVMTMLLTLEAAERGQISLSDMVTISPRAASMGGSQMFMEAGEQQTVETLLKGMAICSANDACVACGEFVGGSEEIFVEMMNKRAKELGMENTNFVNTNGLPVADHYTSAYDIGLMSKELLQFEATKEWFNTWQTTIKVGLAGKEQTEFGLTNTNRLIKLYPGANGIKTGFTQEAGYCLSGSATKGDLTLIAVVMGCETTGERWAETMRLLDYGFATYDSARIMEKAASYGVVTVDKADPSQVDAVAKDPVSILVKKGEKDSITTEAIYKEGLKAPLKAGDPVGELVVYKDGKELERHPLVAGEDVKKAGLTEIYIRMIKTLM